MGKYGHYNENLYKIPYSDAILHIRDNGEVWWGTYCFVGYYYKGDDNYNEGTGIRIFFIDEYELQGTSIYLCSDEKNCPKEKEPIIENYDNWEDYNEAMAELYGDSYPDSKCYCDGRKVGYIKDINGFVNFRIAPHISAPIIGIILDNVRVFYWDNEDNQDWYRVIVNDTEGYVPSLSIGVNKYNGSSAIRREFK